MGQDNTSHCNSLCKAFRLSVVFPSLASTSTYLTDTLRVTANGVCPESGSCTTWYRRTLWGLTVSVPISCVRFSGSIGFLLRGNRNTKRILSTCDRLTGASIFIPYGYCPHAIAGVGRFVRHSLRGW